MGQPWPFGRIDHQEATLNLYELSRSLQHTELRIISSAVTTLAVAIAATTYGGLPPVCLTQARTQTVLTMYAPRS
jgi:hypothetical protein